MSSKILVVIILWLGVAAAVTKLDPESGKCGCCPKCCSCICEEESLPVCVEKLELCLIQDSSGSIAPSDWTVAKSFLADILSQFTNIQDKTAHISYSSNATLNWNLDSPTGMDTAQAKTALLGLDQFQAAFTNPIEALQLMMAEVFNGNDDPAVPNICLLVTDGRANYFVDMLETIAEDVHETVTVIVVGVTTKINQTELQIMASGPGNANVFFADDFNNLISVIGQAVVKLCLDKVASPSGDKCFCCCPPPRPFAYPNPYGYNPMMGNYYQGGGGGECGCQSKDW